MDSKLSKKIPSVLFTSSFLLLAFFAGCVGLYEDVSTLVDKARCNVRVGIIAEAHFSPPHSDMMFEKALRYFDERNVDAVVFAGDVTQDGALAQWRGVKKIWDKVFPPDSNVMPIVVTGEKDSAKVYEELTGEKYAAAFSLEVKGYTFVGANWKDATGVDAWALKPILAKVGKDKPFFYVQNLVPYATCCTNEGRVADYDGGKVSYMLSKFPNAIAICGRSHTPLTDEAAFWRGDFTCVNAGSFAYAKTRGEKGETKKNVHHGLVMSVYDSSVAFERIDFGYEPKKRARDAGVYVEKLGADWCVDLPAVPAPRPATPAPQFWDDTRLMIFPSEKTVSVRFPPVLAKHTGVRAYAYEVKCLGSLESLGSVERVVYSPACCASEDRETKPVTCDFPRGELPKGEVRFEVTPIDAFGRRGKAITGSANLL